MKKILSKSSNKTYENAGITGNKKATTVIPKNMDGTQGVDQYTSKINKKYTGGGKYELRVSEFTNGMDSVNVSVFADSNYIDGKMNLKPGDTFLFEVPANTGGQNFRVAMSTNSSSQGKCSLAIKER